MNVAAGVLERVSGNALDSAAAVQGAQPSPRLADAAGAMANSPVGDACAGYDEVECAVRIVESRFRRISEIALGHDHALQVTEEDFAADLDAMGTL